MMIKQLLLAATVAAGLSPFAFGPASAQPTIAGGHYEWRPARQYGPRTSLQAPIRVWIPYRTVAKVAIDGHGKAGTIVQPDPVFAGGQDAAMGPYPSSPLPIG